MAKWARLYDKNGSYLRDGEAWEFTQEDKDRYDFRCICCGRPVFLYVSKKNKKYNHFSGNDHLRDENGDKMCSEDKSINVVTQYEGIIIDTENPFTYKKREGELGPGPGPGPGPKPGPKPGSDGPTAFRKKQIVLKTAKQYFEFLHNKNPIMQITEEHKVEDLYIPNVEAYYSLKNSKEFGGIKLVLLKRCKRLEELPKDYACFTLLDDSVFSDRKFYFLVKFVDSKDNFQFRKDCFDKEERKDFNYIAIIGEWENYGNYDNVYITKPVDWDAIHFVNNKVKK